MEEPFARHEVRGGQNRTSVTFDFAAFEELPDSNVGRAKNWTKEMDAALLEYWPRKMQRDVARLLGVCDNVARARYRYLTKV